MTIEELRTKHPDWILMEAIVGSQSFGLATPASDVDKRGVFVLPLNERISYEAFDQVADEKNNEVYWELSKFIDLLDKCNPSALEFLFSPEKCITVGEVFFEDFRNLPVNYACMKCKDTFLGYAAGQIARARGLNKKVTKPQPKEAPKILDYCWILDQNKGSIPVKEWLAGRTISNQKCYALAAVDHFDMGYYVYCEDVEGDGLKNSDKKSEHEWRWAYGIVSDEAAFDVQLNSIPKGVAPVAFMTFNKNAFSKACKDHTEYWKWFGIKNEERYKNTIDQGQGYDAKNCMHCIRLLMTAKDIAENGTITVDRTKDREFLLSIKAGKYTYEQVIKMMEDLKAEIEVAFEKSNLPESPFDGKFSKSDVFIAALTSLRYETEKFTKVF